MRMREHLEKTETHIAKLNDEFGLIAYRVSCVEKNTERQSQVLENVMKALQAFEICQAKIVTKFDVVSKEVEETRKSLKNLFWGIISGISLILIVEVLRWILSLVMG